MPEPESGLGHSLDRNWAALAYRFLNLHNLSRVSRFRIFHSARCSSDVYTHVRVTVVVDTAAQAFEDLRKVWHSEASLQGVKVNELVEKAYLCVWRHYENGCLDEARYVAAPAPRSAGEIEEEVDENALQTIRSAVQTSACSSPAAGEHVAEPMTKRPEVLLLDPTMTFQTPEEQAAQAHADRWAEGSVAVDMLRRVTRADYAPENRLQDPDGVFFLHGVH